MEGARDTRTLFEGATRGDAPAVDALLERFLPDLQRYVNRHAAGLVAALLERLEDRRFEYRGEAEFRKWLYGAALMKISNRARYWRAEKRDAGREASPAGKARVLGPLHPRTLLVRINLAMLLVELGRYEEGAAEFCELAPLVGEVFGGDGIQTASALMRCGRCRVELGQPGSAVPELARALRIMDPLVGFDPMKVEGHYFMGRALHELGDAAGAERHLRDGLALGGVVPAAEHLPALVDLLVLVVEERGGGEARAALHTELERAGWR